MKKNVSSKKTTTKSVQGKSAPKKSKVKMVKFSKYCIMYQSIAFILALAALTLNLCNCIDFSVMIDLFGLSVICLAFSLFPEKIN